MELLDIYDENRMKTGRTIVRGEKPGDGEYRLVVHVCVFDSQGRLLIQQRQPFVIGWSGLWDISVGGHASAGDDSRTAAQRETHEELGLDIDFDGLRPALTMTWPQGFDDFYIVHSDAEISSLKLQPEEVRDARWATLDEIMTMIDNDVFIPYKKPLIELLFSLKDSTGTHTRQDRR
ncbi:MAG: NUDIX domain-containing protein [Huintestinicola sp.]